MRSARPERAGRCARSWCRLVVAAVVAVLSAGPTGALAAPLRDEAPPRLRIGTAVVGADTLADTAYAETLAREYSSGTPENDLKWGLVHPTRAVYDFADADAQLAFLEANGMSMRGHTLVWHNQNPDWLRHLPAGEMRAALDDHIATVVGRYQGRIREWDVVNEAIAPDGSARSTLWSRRIGFPGYVDRAFRRASAADPAADLYYNDFGIERPGPKFDGVVRLVQGMLRRGVPIDGVGIQAHLIAAPCASRCANALLTNMLRLRRLGLDVAITELDVGILLPVSDEDLRRQAQVYASVLQACLLAPNCRSFTTWGFTDRFSWVPSYLPGFGAALPYDEGYRAKPARLALGRTLADPPRRPRCGDYATRTAAQRAFDRGVLGAPLLDPDGNGRAC